MQIIHNFSKDFDYHKQMNNKRHPITECGPCSDAMAWYQSGRDKPDIDGELDDYITAQCYTDAAKEQYKILYPTWYKSDGVTPLYEPHTCFNLRVWVLNNLANDNIAEFRSNITIQQSIEMLNNGYGITTWGHYPYNNGTISHVCSLAGYVTDNGIKYMIFDDPFGNPNKQYTGDFTGNNVWITMDNFYAWICNGNFKFTGTIIKPYRR